MKQSRWHIRFTAGFLAVWLLTLATTGQAFSAKKTEAKKETNAKKPKVPADEVPTVQALSFEVVVVPALSFDFTQDFYFLPKTFTLDYLTVTLRKQFAVFYYYFSFFRTVFGTSIAINAP